MTKPDSFLFKHYLFDEDLKTLELKYAFSDGMDFTETYYFDFTFAQYDNTQLERAFEYLLLIAGVSYFKAFAPRKLELVMGKLTQAEAEFFNKTYEKGLGEYWYTNKLDPKTKINFPVNLESKQVAATGKHGGLLVGLGGGKDSLVVVEALKGSDLDFMTWSLNHRPQFEPLVKRLGTKHAFVERKIDPSILDLNKLGAYNGHIPISAIFAVVGVVVAILSGRKDVVVANEQTANEPSLSYQGVPINHQYSKSQEFEKDFQELLTSAFGDSLRYYSFLRPLTELRVAELFSQVGFKKYQDVFSSCNRAYTLDSNHLFWCGECPKCAFVFLILTPFIERSQLEKLWHGKNLLRDASLSETYEQLLGISGNKPLDCVGEIKEARAAMRLCFEVYPELKELYSFELPADYDYKKLYDSEMPKDILAVFNNFIEAADK